MATLLEPLYVGDISSHQQIEEDLYARSNSLPDGEYVGAVLTFPEADGFAVYVVEALDLATGGVWLRHVPIFDAYSIPEPYVRGLNAADVVTQVDRDRESHRAISRLRERLS